MLFTNIKIGDRLEITMKRSAAAQAFVSQVEEVRGEDEIDVVMPITYGQVVKLPQGEKYSMLFFTQSGMIRFDAEITGYKKDGNIQMMTVALTTDGERIQRRGHFRYGVLLPLRFAPISDSITYTAGKEEMFEGVVKDISGGGIRFVTNVDVAEAARVKCLLMIGGDCVIIIGTVLRRQYFPKSNYKYQYRVQFVGLTNEDEEKVVQFIFNEQRKEITRHWSGGK